MPTDDDLTEKFKSGTFIWADVNGNGTICFLQEDNGTETYVDSEQAQRLFDTGMIELPIPELSSNDWDETLWHWHLTEKGQNIHADIQTDR